VERLDASIPWDPETEERAAVFLLLTNGQEHATIAGAETHKATERERERKGDAAGREERREGREGERESARA
jgi:hypothetical protein